MNLEFSCSLAFSLAVQWRANFQVVLTSYFLACGSVWCLLTQPWILSPFLDSNSGIGGTRFISFEGRHWHNDCFNCTSCKASMVGKGFITDQEDILCPECAKKRLMADAVEQWATYAWQLIERCLTRRENETNRVSGHHKEDHLKSDPGKKRYSASIGLIFIWAGRHGCVNNSEFGGQVTQWVKVLPFFSKNF